MRHVMTSTVRWLRVGWFWPLVLLALPNCAFQAGVSTLAPQNLVQGPLPHDAAVYCDIEQVLTRHCATDEDKANGVRLAAGAVALTEGDASGIGLDYSADSLNRCAGQPEAVGFQGSFPVGSLVCLNSSVIGSTYVDAKAVCVTQCEDVFSPAGAEVPPDPQVVAFCTAHAAPSTNMPTNPPFFAGGCTDAGNPNDAFVDPRKSPEPVVWQDLIGVGTSGGSGNTLTRTAATSGAFDAGAASTQTIAAGDAFVELTASETNTARIGGLSSGASDPGAAFATVGFGLDLFDDAHLYIFESGAVQTGPSPTGNGPSFGAYASGDRFRVHATDNFDGTATITYAKVTGPCNDGAPCAETVLYTSPTKATYPLRVDSSFKQSGGTLTNVRLARIH
jgi:hypothetical protein